MKYQLFQYSSPDGSDRKLIASSGELFPDDTKGASEWFEKETAKLPKDVTVTVVDENHEWFIQPPKEIRTLSFGEISERKKKADAAKRIEDAKYTSRLADYIAKFQG